MVTYITTRWKRKLPVPCYFRCFTFLLCVATVTDVTVGINMDWETVEDFCTLSETIGRSYKDVNLGLMRYKQQCKDFEKFIKCVGYVRGHREKVANLNIPPYDKFFPDLDDWRYAGFHFCNSYLPLLERMFPPEKSMDTCVVPKEQCKTDFIKDSDVVLLKDAVEKWDEAKAKTLSCKVMAPYTNCIAQAYIKCSEDFRLLVEYELAKYGGDCLEAAQVQSPVVAVSRCDPRYRSRDRTISGTASQSSGIVPLTILVAVVSRLIIASL
ncbi:uncharacterized protein LOC131934039 [Physella acuta]|uniref:uncharacterized protein LOC131934039 n=1 Tax=Physella acuta TaxID=109671 RepID=UPI0027DC0692|nr:uncharacterized protein LOC131934039 [Physella acuta]